MTDAPPPDPPPAPSAGGAPPAAVPPLPVAKKRRSRWIGTVWALPLAALIIVAFLGVRAFSDRGIDVVVTFPTGGGARVDDTKVIYQGVEAGRVVKIEVNPDGRNIDLTLRLDPRAEPAMTTTAQFWLVGVNPSLSDISSVKAALAGVTIGVAPGRGGEKTRHFVGAAQPPVIPMGTPGTAFVLNTASIGNLAAGAPLYYHGQVVGRITLVNFVDVGKFRLDVYLLAPYDRLIRPRAMFWISSPVQVSLDGGGARLTVEHASSLLNGAVEIDFPASAAGEAPAASTPSTAGTAFTLFQSRRDAEMGDTGPEVPYQLRFGGSAGSLAVGAEVRLYEFPVGRVDGVRLEIDPQSGRGTTLVDAVLFPKRLQLAQAPGAGPNDGLRQVTDRFVERLLANGHRAVLAQSPPLIGARSIALDKVQGGAGTPQVAHLGPGRLIPSAEGGGDLDQITGQANQLLAKLNRVPLEAIGQQAQRVVARLGDLVDSPEIRSSLQHLNGTLAQADRMMADAAPQIGPLIGKLNGVADELSATAGSARGLLGGDGGGRVGGGDTSLPAAVQELSDAARSIRELADYLTRHPESLLRGRGSKEPEPLPAAPKSR